jgi:hypothetical protein
MWMWIIYHPYMVWIWITFSFTTHIGDTTQLNMQYKWGHGCPTRKRHISKSAPKAGYELGTGKQENNSAK